MRSRDRQKKKKREKKRDRTDTLGPARKTNPDSDQSRMREYLAKIISGQKGDAKEEKGKRRFAPIQGKGTQCAKRGRMLFGWK